MSNPTELPDLDRDYFNRKLATIVRDLSSYTAQEMARELVRLAKVADEIEVVKEARRAQPEGEVPQAEKCAQCSGHFMIYREDREVPCPSCQVVDDDDDEIDDPAAQHAESGAQAAGVQDQFDQWQHARLFANPPQSVTPYDAYVAGLAAQSQGAQAAGHFVFEHGCWVATSSDDPRAVKLYRAAQQAAAPGALQTAKNALQLLALNLVPHNPRAVAKGALQAIELAERTATSAPGTPEAPQTAAARDVLAERQRQVEQEGWTPARDDQCDDRELAMAAAGYIMAGKLETAPRPKHWPWPIEWWKPRGLRRNLVRAGALVLAEIERLDRAAQLDGGQEGSGS